MKVLQKRKKGPETTPPACFKQTVVNLPYNRRHHKVGSVDASLTGAKSLNLTAQEKSQKRGASDE